MSKTIGRFVVLEGGEAVGKTTIMPVLCETLRSWGMSVISAREPGGTAPGEKMRSILQDDLDVDVHPRAELLGYLFSRVHFVEDIVRPALEEGSTVVADRFALSTLAYQGYGRGLSEDAILSMNAFATDDLEPDLYILLWASEEEVARRVGRTSEEPDKIEPRSRHGHVLPSLSESACASLSPLCVRTHCVPRCERGMTIFFTGVRMFRGISD